MINKDQFTPQAWLRTPEDMGVANHIKKHKLIFNISLTTYKWTK